MAVFVALALGGFLLVAGSFLFSHDHDLGHDVGADHDLGDDAGGGEGEGHTISIFSTKVLGTFIMGFGAAGAIARYYDRSPMAASGMGVLCGVGLGVLMYWLMDFFVQQQASSLIQTRSLIGCTGTVTVAIGSDSPGEVGVSVNDRYGNYMAKSHNGVAIPKGSMIEVVQLSGSTLSVIEIHKA